MSARTRLFVALVSTGVIGYLALGALLGRVMGDNSYGQLAVFNEVVRLVIDGYVDPIEIDRPLAAADRGLLEALDGDSAYLDSETLRRYKDSSLQGDADIGVELSRRFGFLMVVAARPGSPAEEAGLRPGDIIKTIDGVHTRPLSGPAGQHLLHGEPGSMLELTILRAGIDPLDLSVTRERITDTPVQSRAIGDDIGYIRLSEFTPDSGDQVSGEIELLRRAGAGKLVLDLRSAAFGDPADGVGVAELFVGDGVLARRAGRNVAEQVWKADPEKVVWDGPLAALVDTGTAGPGEIVAAALFYAKRAELVGRHTFGRAAIQKLLPLPDGALLLTVAQYTAGDGTSIHGAGLAPTVPVEEAIPDDLDEEAEPAAARDDILDAAVEHLRAPAEGVEEEALDPAA
jgi:carboxyl-terminal processing protease